jgi:hypothetical protein
MQQCLKAASGAAWAWIVPAQLLDQLFLAMDDAISPLDLRLRGETSSTFAHRLESKRPDGDHIPYAWRTSFMGVGESFPETVSEMTGHLLKVRYSACGNFGDEFYRQNPLTSL